MKKSVNARSQPTNATTAEPSGDWQSGCEVLDAPEDSTAEPSPEPAEGGDVAPEPAAAEPLAQQQPTKALAPPSIVDALADRTRREREAEAADLADWRERGRSRYAALLLRNDLSDSAVAELADLAADLGIEIKEMERDRAMIEQARQLAGLHDQREEAAARSREATERYAGLRKRQEDEERALRRERTRTAADHWACARAAAALRALAEARPHFFDEQDPPRLRQID